MIKNKKFKNLGLLLIGILFFGCQNLEQPAFSDFPFDGPMITIISPSPSGATVVRSTEPTVPFTIKFQVVDDLGIASIIVKFDDVEIANLTTFTNNQLVEIDDLVFDNVTTGTHVVSITATDTNDVVVTETAMFEKVDVPPYAPMFDGEIFYMPFDGDYAEAITGNGATVIGSPSFTADAKIGTGAYKGAEDSYLTYPTTDLLGNEFSASFWYNIDNPGTNRAGILTVSAPDPSGADKPGNRNFGFRFFREGGAKQGFKLNVGNGTGNTTAVTPNTLENGSGWMHVAFTISGSKAIIYLNGEVAGEKDLTGLDFTGCESMSIMSGAPLYTVFNHLSDFSGLDELRIFNKVLSPSEVTNMNSNGNKTFNMPFNGSYLETISKTDATVVGMPTITDDAKEGSGAYKGENDSYLTFPTSNIVGNEISATFYYKINNPGTNRAGILTVSAPDPSGADKPGNRNFGFRFFREGGVKQGFKLNVGNGTGNTTAVTPNTLENDSDYVHVAFTISSNKAIIYLNGEIAGEKDLNGLDFTGCESMSIMSGAPLYTVFNHLSDLSSLDELEMYNKVLSQTEIQATMN